MVLVPNSHLMNFPINFGQPPNVSHPRSHKIRRAARVMWKLEQYHKQLNTEIEKLHGTHGENTCVPLRTLPADACKHASSSKRFARTRLVFWCRGTRTKKPSGASMDFIC